MSVSQISRNQNEIMLLWDESHIWGLMLWRSLCLLGFSPKVIRSQEIRHGILSHSPPKLILVPGGWASRKALSLNESGQLEIRNFLSETKGTYLGLCGGAGLALSNDNNSSLGLCPWTRKPVHKRLPNCSGHIYVEILSRDKNLYPEGEIDHIKAPIWWPSQFEPHPESHVDVLACYQTPATDFWVADLPVSSLPKDNLSFWENLYNINLDPETLRGEPCLIQGRYGQGRYLLSYVHLETPASPEANKCLHDLILTLTGHNKSEPSLTVPEWDLKSLPIFWQNRTLIQAKQNLDKVIETSQENFFLCWRKPWLLGWKRGFPGFAINTLYALVVQSLGLPPNTQVKQFWDDKEQSFKQTMGTFIEQFHLYLGKLRLNLNQGLLSNQDPLSTKIEEEKRFLFGPFPGQGGLFGELVTILQEVLWLQIKQLSPRNHVLGILE